MSENAPDREAANGTNLPSGSVTVAGGVRLIELHPGVWVRAEEVAGVEERTWSEPYSRIYLRGSSSFVEVRLSPAEVVARLEEERP